MNNLFRHLTVSIWSYRLVRAAVSLVFIASASEKLADPESFAVIIDAYGIIPGSWSLMVAFLLLFFELTAGMLLLFDIRGSLSVLTALLTIFMIILIYGIQMGLDVDCGCFGPGDPEADAFHNLRSALYRDIVILAGITYLYLWRIKMNVEGVRLSTLTQIFKKGG